MKFRMNPAANAIGKTTYKGMLAVELPSASSLLKSNRVSLSGDDDAAASDRSLAFVAFVDSSVATLSETGDDWYSAAKTYSFGGRQPLS